jgi:hypothetical protein
MYAGQVILNVYTYNGNQRMPFDIFNFSKENGTQHYYVSIIPKQTAP